jgi:predicted Zn-dependent protease
MVDDPLDRRGRPNSFDYEGQPKKKLVIVKNGVIKNIAYDSYYSQKYGRKNTAHALPALNVFGPLPAHLVIKPGQVTLPQMISRVKKGLLVTRLWYIRVVHFGEMLLTGMTRDGLFLIENGEITRPVKNLRFTESLPRMFKNIIEIGSELSPHPSWGDGAHLVPPMRIADFRFTSQTEF